MSPDDAERKKQSTAGVFDRAAPTYGQVGPAVFAHFGRRLAVLAQIMPGAQVLDVAAGRGALLFPAAEAAGAQGRVVGVDLSVQMVRELSAELAQSGVANAEARQMDAESLQFPDASFDRVLCGMSLFLFPHPERALAEFHRVLKPGGRAAISTLGKLFHAQWQWFDELVAAYLPPAPPSDATATAYDKPEQLVSALRASGFADVSTFVESAEFVYADAEEWWASLWSHGARAALEAVEHAKGAEGLAHFRADAFAHVQAHSKEDGFHFPMDALCAIALKL